MKTYTVSIQVIKIYHVAVRAENEEGAIGAAYNLQTTEIARDGKFKDASTDYAEVVGVEEEPNHDTD